MNFMEKGFNAAYTLPVTIILFIAGSYWPILLIISAIPFLLYVSGLCASYFLFYHTIKCPECGHNPTRRKDGKVASPRYLEGKFKKMTECPECAYSPPHAPSP